MRLKGEDTSKAEDFLSSSEFLNELNGSEHDFIREIRIILTSQNDEVTVINFD